MVSVEKSKPQASSQQTGCNPRKLGSSKPKSHVRSYPKALWRCLLLRSPSKTSHLQISNVSAASSMDMHGQQNIFHHCLPPNGQQRCWFLGRSTALQREKAWDIAMLPRGVRKELHSRDVCEMQMREGPRQAQLWFPEVSLPSGGITAPLCGSSKIKSISHSAPRWEALDDVYSPSFLPLYKEENFGSVSLLPSPREWLPHGQALPHGGAHYRWFRLMFRESISIHHWGL